MKSLLENSLKASLDENFEKELRYVSDEIQDFMKFVKPLKDVELNRNKYKVEWALDDLIEKASRYMKTTKTIKEVDNDLLLLANKNHNKKEHKMKRYSSLIKLLTNLINIIEVVLSIFLVLFLSKISHHGELLITIEWLSLGFVVFFAFIKVMIEKHILFPLMEYLGWYMYKKIIRHYKIRIITILAIDVIFDYSENNDLSTRETDEMITKYLNHCNKNYLNRLVKKVY